MDKVKVYLAVLKKHHFWLLVVIAVLLSTYGWYAGTKALDTQFASNKSTIDSAFSGVRAIKMGDPNPSFKEKTDVLHEQQKKNALIAWQKLYDRQRANLKWPQIVKHIDNLSAKAPISSKDRETFWQYFRAEFPKLFSRVEPFEQIPDQDNEGGAAQRGDKEARFQGIVDWSSADREALVKRYDWSSTPSIQQVRLAQEDYWIYQSLLDIIATVNKGAGATSPTNAAIGKIELLKIAQDAFDSGIPVIDLLAKEAFPPTGESSTQPKPPSAASTDDDLLRHRYAGFDGKPLEAPEENAEFKLIPVRLRLVMDQRRIPDFLVACANSPLPVEVRHVRFNPGSTAGRGAMGSGDSAPSGGSLGPRASMGAPSGGASGTLSGPAPGASTSKSAPAAGDVYVATVEFRGVIYFFTAPNKELLGGGTGAGEEGAEDDTGTSGGQTTEESAEESGDASAATDNAGEASEAAPAAEGNTGEGAAAGESSSTTEAGTESGATSEPGTTAEPGAPAEPGAAGATPTEPDAGSAPPETPAAETP